MCRNRSQRFETVMGEGRAGKLESEGGLVFLNSGVTWVSLNADGKVPVERTELIGAVVCVRLVRTGSSGYVVRWLHVR